MEFVGRDADNGAYEESLVEVYCRRRALAGSWEVHDSEIPYRL